MGLRRTNVHNLIIDIEEIYFYYSNSNQLGSTKKLFYSH